MFRFLLILLAITTACRADCSVFSGVNHNVDLIPELSGTFYVVQSTLNDPLSCEKSIWSVDVNDVITAFVEIPGCCMAINNFDTSSSTSISYTVNPLTGSCVWTYTPSASLKLISTMTAGTDICLVLAVCHEPRDGIIIACPQKNVVPLLLDIIALLEELLSPVLAVLQIAALTPVSQSGCVFGINNCTP